MKRLFALLVVLSLFLSACSTVHPNNADTGGDTESNSTESQLGTPNSTNGTTASTESNGETGSTETTQGTESTTEATIPNTNEKPQGGESTQPTQSTTEPITNPTTTPTTEPDTKPTPNNESTAPTTPPTSNTEPTIPPSTESTSPTVPTPVTPTLVINTPNNTALNIGESLQLDYTYSGDKSKLTWRSTYPDKVSVDQNGKVTALAEGNSLITVNDGNTSRRINIDVRADLPKATDVTMHSLNAPLSNDIVKYAGDSMTFKAYTIPVESHSDISVVSSNTGVVSVSWYKDSTNTNHVTLNFKSAGSATVTIKSADGAVSKSYAITVKSGYDFNPGSGQLTPEQWADYCTRVMVANGLTKKTNINSYREITLSADKLTFSTAQSLGQSLAHEWWLSGCYKCWISYEGTDENGNYVFYTRWG